MATLKKLSGIFYKISKILLIIGIIGFAIGGLVCLGIGVANCIGSALIDGTQEQKEALLAGGILSIGYAIWLIVEAVLSIVALALVKKARSSNEVKHHVVAAVFGLLSLSGELSVVAAVLAIIFIKRGGKFGDEVVEAKTVEAKSEDK